MEQLALQVPVLLAGDSSPQLSLCGRRT